MNAPAALTSAAPLLYWPGETNRCPQCSGKSWHVGRAAAECAGCGHPLPLARQPETGEPVWEPAAQ
jgi:ribosomal protein L37E